MSEERLRDLIKRIKRVSTEAREKDTEYPTNFPGDVIMGSIPSTRFESRIKDLEDKVETMLVRYRAHKKDVSEVLMGIIPAITERDSDVNEFLGTMVEELRELHLDVHAHLVHLSAAEDSKDILLPRFMWVRAYLSQAGTEQTRTVEKSIRDLLDATGFEVADEFGARKGSWFGKWIARTKEFASQPEVNERLKKLERALELKGLIKPQTEADERLAGAASMLLQALDKVPNAAIQIGSLLLVKTLDNGESSVFVRSLTQKEVLHIETNQRLLEDPATVLEKLAALSQMGRTETEGALPEHGAAVGAQSDHQGNTRS